MYFLLEKGVMKFFDQVWWYKKKVTQVIRHIWYVVLSKWFNRLQFLTASISWIWQIPYISFYMYTARGYSVDIINYVRVSMVTLTFTVAVGTETNIKFRHPQSKSLQSSYITWLQIDRQGRHNTIQSISVRNDWLWVSARVFFHST